MINNIFEMTITRILTVYVVQGFLCIFFLYIAYRIIQRGKKRINLVFSAFYFTEGIGLIINFIYAPIEITDTVIFFNFLTNFCVLFGIVLLFLFVLILLKSEKVINTTKQMIILITNGVILVCMVLIAFIPDLGVTMEAPDWAPVWGWIIYVYAISIMSLLIILPTLFYAYKIYQDFEDELLKKKWKFFIIGCLFLYSFIYAVFTSNFLNIKIVRTINNILGLILVVSGSLLTYYGVGRQID